MKRQMFSMYLDPAPGETGGGNAPAGISVEEHHKGIEKSRLEERQKLHGDIQRASEAQAAAAKLATEAQAEATKLKAELDAIKASTTSEGNKVDVQKLVAEITTAAEARFKAASEAESARLSTEIGTLRSNLSTMQLEKLRAQLVAENGGTDKLVTALIDASSEDSLRKSIATAKAAFAEVENRVKAAAGTPPQPSNATNLNASPIINPSGAGGAGGGTEGTLLASVKQMGVKDYAAIRTKALSELKNRFPTVRQ